MSSKVVTQQSDSSKGKLPSISRGEGMQQREQLKQMILKRFISDLAKNNKQKEQQVRAFVDEFFRTSKVTESTLRELKVKVYTTVSGKTSSQQGSQMGADDNKSQKSRKSGRSIDKNQDDNISQKSQKSRKSQGKASVKDDQLSQTSSKPPASVYNLGNEEDEWATLVKFDTELFKKEQDLEKLRQAEFKKNMKSQLDRQLQDKYRRQNEDRNEDNAYVDLQFQQLNAYDKREQDKYEERLKKVTMEKKQRDKQVQDEYQRKKQEKRRDKQLDEMLVQRIKEEKALEENEAAQRKQREKQRLIDSIKENGEYKKIQDEEARRDRINDIELNKEYMRLQDELQATRDYEKQQREEKIKRIMSSQAETVVKDQKSMVKQEDQRMLDHILEQNYRDKQEESKKKQELLVQKGQMREYLKKQIEDRDAQKMYENDLNKMQAEIWSKDRQNYAQHESEKQAYINMVNKKHQSILIDQMQENDKKNKKSKMNADELLQNQAKFKEILSQNPSAGGKTYQ